YSRIDTTNKWVSDLRRRSGTDTVEKFKNGTWQFAYIDSIKDRTVSKGYIAGNSTIADLPPGAVDANSYNGIHRYVISKADSAVGRTIINNAIAGITIHQQDSVWLADANKSTYDWIIVEIGLNDLIYTESAATALARYQTFIDDINLYKKPGAKVIVSTMTPCKQRLLDLYGSTNGLISYQKWLDMNDAISGAATNRITGVDYRVTNHTLALNDGNDNLKPIYDIGDHVHESNAARELIALFSRYALNEVGYLQVTQPKHLEQSQFYIVGDTIRAFDVNASLFIGETINGLTDSPIRLNVGGTYGTYGDPRSIKIMTYDPGLNDSTLWAGIGVTNMGQTYHTPVGQLHSFFAGPTTSNPLLTLEKISSTESKMKFPGGNGFVTTATPSNIDFTGTLANSFGDPTKGKIFLFNNSGLLASIGHSYDGVSSQFELHTYSNSSFHFY
ncbi:MAG TPA: SGNH/GDSL hydrolase family protein, partial [Flavisolibacter sp.]|nr:SGNH/GDSL hydrolase family protein [Flavisolibacter sp.]